MSLLLLIVIYISFISLGLPDSILGASWPSMYEGLGAEIYLAGVIGMIAAFGTIVSSLMSAKLITRFDTGRVTLVSVAMTAAALMGISFSTHVWQICALAIILGLGAGTVDAALNNFVALHYKSRHMSWLHSFWGIGATTGPYIIGICLTAGLTWNAGYRTIAIIQSSLVAVLFISLPLWKKKSAESAHIKEKFKALTIRETLKLPGAKPVLVALFCYCAIELTTGLWASSYMVINKGITAETAAKWGSLFYLGITAGRFLGGLITEKLGNKKMIQLGLIILTVGIILFILPFSNALTLAALITIGVGCAPIFPSILHETPNNFGAENSQSIMGMQMAAAYVGSTFMPPLFGGLAKISSIGMLPYFLLMLTALMIFMNIRAERVFKAE